MSRSDYPRSFPNWLWLWWFPRLDALPVAPALAVTLHLAGRCLPVSLLRLPPRPFPRLSPAAIAAIALVCLSRMKALLAPLEQTRPQPRPPRPALSPPSRLILARIGKILGRAHGR